MAYGKGKTKNHLKRMADIGSFGMNLDLSDLRMQMLSAFGQFTSAVWPDDILDPVLNSKEIDRLMVVPQSKITKRGLNAVWAEKARLIVKSAMLEQWKRGQHTLFGKFKNISTIGDKPIENGPSRLVNLPEEYSWRLSEVDVAALQELADGLDYKQVLELFRMLRTGDADLSPLQAEALRAMADVVRNRYKCPVWKDDAVVQLHLDYRCVRGGKDVLAAALETLNVGLSDQVGVRHVLPLTSAVSRGNIISIQLQMCFPVAQRLGGDDATAAALMLELGPVLCNAKAVVAKPSVKSSLEQCYTVLADDFGYTNTSSLAVVRSTSPISAEAFSRVGGHNGEDMEKITKSKAKKFLEENVSGDETVLLELMQFDGMDFLDRIVEQALKIDSLRSEIDRMYNRLNRIRAEINYLAGNLPEELIPENPEYAEHRRYMTMHGRFFRILSGINKLKAKRRGIYAAVAGLKKSWFGYIANKKADLAEKYNAIVVSEDLSIASVPTDDPKYKGRTFNKLHNNGSKGQYSRRSEDTLKWRGITSVKIPSYYTSSTDWRDGTVDKKQRSGKTFKASSDGNEWDADLHAAEMIGRYLFLRPKTDATSAALAA